MKPFLLTLSGPVVATIAFLRLAYLIGQPSALMLSFIVLSLLFALGIAFVGVRKHIARSPQFWRIGITSLAFCLVTACSWAVFWAISEEFYIHYFTDAASDMPGIERYIYPGNSGMGFARGIQELPRSLGEASLAAGILAIAWTPVAFGLFALCNTRSKNGPTDRISQAAGGRLAELPLGECCSMRRKMVIVAAGALFLGTALTFFWLRPAPPPAGKFPPSFSSAERREIVAAARRDATRQTLAAIRRAEFRVAARWIVNARKQTVRGVGQQPGGQIWVHFGFDDPKATDGYALWARYFMTKTNGHWQVVQLF